MLVAQGWYIALSTGCVAVFTLPLIRKALCHPQPEHVNRVEQRIHTIALRRNDLPFKVAAQVPDQMVQSPQAFRGKEGKHRVGLLPGPLCY